MKKRILIVSYYFAPQNTIGAIRPTKLAKYLQRMGHEVTVICGTGMDGRVDPTLQRDLQELEDVHILREWNPLRQWKQRGKKAAAEAGTAPASVQSQGADNVHASAQSEGADSAHAPAQLEGADSAHAPAQLEGADGAHAPAQSEGADKAVRRSRLGRVLNSLYLWLWVLSDKSFLRRGYRELKQLKGSYDAVFSSYSPMSAHEIAGRAKKQGLAKHWIADFRDELDISFAWQEGRRRRLWQTLNRYADGLTAVSDGTLEMMGLSEKGQVLWNGFDREDQPKAEKPADGCFRAVYCGQFHMGRKGVGDRDLTPIFAAFAQAVDKGLLDKGRLKLVYAGSDGAAFERYARACGLEECVELHGTVSREDSLRLQAQADALLMATWNLPGQTGILTGKLFEYLMMEKPVLCYTSGEIGGGELKRVIDRCRVGVCAEQAGGQAELEELNRYVEEMLTRFGAGKPLLAQPDREAVDAYTYRGLAEQLSAMLLGNEEENQ